MFVIGEAVVEEEVAHERFACDVVQCKGACCRLPGAAVRHSIMMSYGNSSEHSRLLKNISSEIW